MREHTELEHFLAMLDRAGVGYGLRVDHNPSGTAVQVEQDFRAEDESSPVVSEWAFDAAGKLTGVFTYEPENGSGREPVITQANVWRYETELSEEASRAFHESKAKVRFKGPARDR